MHHVLQNGFPKSGNYWLWTILTEILNRSGVTSNSYIKRHPIYPVAKNWTLSYPEQAGLDVIDIENNRCFARIGPYFREPIVDFDNYVKQNTLVWTHSHCITDSLDVYKKFTHLFYLVRDPRDVAVSMANFSFTNYRQLNNPTDYRNVEEYLKYNFVKHLTGWCHHVASHIEHGVLERCKVIFYEDLKNDPVREIEKIKDYMGILGDEGLSEKVASVTSVDVMKGSSGDHVRRGNVGGWRETLSTTQINKARLIAGPLLRQCGYPLGRDGCDIEHPESIASSHSSRRTKNRAVIARGANVVYRHLSNTPK